MMVGNIHNARILRFLLVIGAVVLTIFIYASYSTGPQLAPAHMHTHISLPPEALQQQYSLNYSKTADLSTAGGAGAAIILKSGALYENHRTHESLKKMYYSNANSVDGNSQMKKTHHRQPTVDIDAGGSDITNNNLIDDGPADEAALDRLVNNYFLDEQYVSNVDAMGNINNSSGVTTGGDGTLNSIPKNSDQKQINEKDLQKAQQKLKQYPQDNSKKEKNDANNNNSKAIINANSKVLDSDVLIPTSNLQKFIENADKILKNITASTTNSIVSPQQQQLPAAQPPQQQQEKHQEEDKLHQLQTKDVNAKNGETKASDTNDHNDDEESEDYDETQQNSVIMTIKSAAQIDEEKNRGEEEQEKLKNEQLLKKEQENLEKSGKPIERTGSKLKQVVAKILGVPKVTNDNVNKQEKAKPPNAGDVPVPAQAPVQPQAVSKAAPVKNLTSTTVAKPLDTSQGIPTRDIYESGHLDEELDIERICPNEGADLKLLILITSAQSHFEARLSIRQTWGHYSNRRDVSIAFVVGRSANQTLNLALTQENFIYGDLIRGNFIDSYNNLTLKTISSLEWVDHHCSRAKFILKTDDDMFINVPKLLQFLEGHSKDKRTIYGRLAKKWKPVRNKKSKYYVSTTQFSATVFPSFTTGPAYVLTSDITHDLYERSLQQVYFKLEDVFTTGIVAQQLNIKRVHVNEFLNRRIAFNPCNIRKTISVHMIKANEQFDLWKKLLDQTVKCK